MDGAPPQSPDMAEAKALTALNFQRPAGEVEDRFSADLVRIAELLGLAPDLPWPDAERLVRYVWARAALDYGILLLVGEESRDGVDRLICTLQEDGSCLAVERPTSWDLEAEARYVARFKELFEARRGNMSNWTGGDR